MAISEQQKQINMEKFKLAQERAKKLIHSDARQEIAEGKTSKYIPTLKESISKSHASMTQDTSFDDYEVNEPNYLNEEQMSNIHAKAQSMPINTSNGIKNSKVPSAILKEFASNPIDTSSLETNMGMESQSSVLDMMGIKPKQKQIIKESNSVPIVQPNVTTNTTVDYSLIKTIVEDCMRKMIPTIKKSVLTENKNTDDNVSLIKLGKNFKFVTSNGDIYEAVLKKTGNLNEIKTK